MKIRQTPRRLCGFFLASAVSDKAQCQPGDFCVNHTESWLELVHILNWLWMKCLVLFWRRDLGKILHLFVYSFTHLLNKYLLVTWNVSGIEEGAYLAPSDWLDWIINIPLSFLVQWRQGFEMQPTRNSPRGLSNKSLGSGKVHQARFSQQHGVQ